MATLHYSLLIQTVLQGKVARGEGGRELYEKVSGAGRFVQGCKVADFVLNLLRVLRTKPRLF